MCLLGSVRQSQNDNQEHVVTVVYGAYCSWDVFNSIPWHVSLRNLRLVDLPVGLQDFPGSLNVTVVSCFFPQPLSQGPRPERPKEPEPDVPTIAGGGDLASMQEGRSQHKHDDDHGIEDGEHGGESGRVGGGGEDSRPKLAPGAMLTLSNLAAEAIMVFTEEVETFLTLPVNSVAF